MDMNKTSRKHLRILQNFLNTITHVFARPEWCFLIIMLLVGSCFAVLVPAGAGADEPNHIARVASVAQGNIRADRIDSQKGFTSPKDLDGVDSVLYGGVVDSALTEVAWHNMIIFHTGKDIDGGQKQYKFPTWQTPGLQSDAVLGRAKHVEAFSNTAVNSPFAYLPYILGYWISQIFTNNAYAIIIIMRLFGLVCTAVIVFFCIKFVPIGKWIVASVSLIPTMFIFNATVTADSMTYAICLAFLTIVLRASLKQGSLSRTNWVLLCITSVALALVKLSYLPLLALLILIPIYNPGVRNRRSVLIGGTTVILTCIVFLAWYLSISKINTGAMFNVGASPTMQKKAMIETPNFFIHAVLKQLIAQNFFNIDVYGTLDLHGHWAYSGWATVLALCCAMRLKDSREEGMKTLQRKPLVFTVIMVFVAFCTFILIETALYLQFNPVGATAIAGVQPRYFLPTLSLILLPILLIDSNQSKQNENEGTSICINNKKLGFSTLAMLSIQLLSAIFSLYILVTSLYSI